MGLLTGQPSGRAGRRLAFAGALALCGIATNLAVPLALAGGVPRDWGPSREFRGQAAAAQLSMRVLLQEASSLAPAAVGGPLWLLDSQGRLLTVLPEGERLRVSRQGAMLRLERPDAPPGNASPQLLAPQDLWLMPVPPRGIASTALLPWAYTIGSPGPYLPFVGLNRHRYRGSLVIRAEGEPLQAINHLDLEAYLASVVGSEMPAGWPAAALRAQAVAARTYALSQRRPAAPFDLRATVASQAYLGVEAESQSTQAAVAATRSQVLRHGGALIDAVFHSSSGGATENSGELWNRQLPYLVSVPDADNLSPWHQWSVRFEPDQLRRAFRETAGANRIDVLSASSSGRVRRARVIGPAGSIELSGNELRQRLGLRSTLVQFRFEAPAPVAASEPNPAPWSDQPPGATPGGITAATALASQRYGRGLEPGGSAGTVRGRGMPPPPPPPPPLGDLVTPSTGRRGADPLLTGLVRSAAAASPIPEAAPALEVQGRGFGHGVGMSQWGAYGLALRGVSYDQILRYYYRGAQLVAYP